MREEMAPYGALKICTSDITILSERSRNCVFIYFSMQDAP